MGEFFLASNLYLWAGQRIFGHRLLRRTLVRSERESAIGSLVSAIRTGCNTESWLLIAESYPKVQECDATMLNLFTKAKVKEKKALTGNFFNVKYLFAFSFFGGFNYRYYSFFI